MNKDPVILSYDESLLRKSDFDLLYGPYWLNDNIISFYFEYLKNTFKETPYLLFISPEVTQCIKIIPNSQIKVFLEPLDAKIKHFIFFALNDNDRPQMAGGTHWSLLVFSRVEKLMYHFDSSRTSNREQAEEFTKKIFTYFNIHGHFKEENCSQQNNGYDCGVHLMCNAEFIAKYLQYHDSLENYGSSNENLRANVANMSMMRQKIIDIIDSLRD